VSGYLQRARRHRDAESRQMRSAMWGVCGRPGSRASSGRREPLARRRHGSAAASLRGRRGGGIPRSWDRRPAGRGVHSAHPIRRGRGFERRRGGNKGRVSCDEEIDVPRRGWVCWRCSWAGPRRSPQRDHRQRRHERRRASHGEPGARGAEQHLQRQPLRRPRRYSATHRKRSRKLVEVTELTVKSATRFSGTLLIADRFGLGAFRVRFDQTTQTNDPDAPQAAVPVAVGSRLDEHFFPSGTGRLPAVRVDGGGLQEPPAVRAGRGAHRR
jgi:hypothetical protein